MKMTLRTLIMLTTLAFVTPFGVVFTAKRLMAQASEKQAHADHLKDQQEKRDALLELQAAEPEIETTFKEGLFDPQADIEGMVSTYQALGYAVWPIGENDSGMFVSYSLTTKDGVPYEGTYHVRRMHRGLRSVDGMWAVANKEKGSAAFLLAIEIVHEISAQPVVLNGKPRP